MADKPTSLETVERFLRVIREATLLAGLGFVLYFLGPHIPSIASQLGKAQVNQIELPGVKLTFQQIQQVEATLQAAVKAEAPREGREDRQVGEQTKLIADALQTLGSAAQLPAPGSVPSPEASGTLRVPGENNLFWVYLGARRGGAWLTRYFDLKVVPPASTSILATADVFRRRSIPVFRQGQWIMGDTLGVLPAGKAVTVVRTESVPGTENRELWWAEVTLK